ncbi:MAG: carbohydrate ABC transporter permease [Treponema sp.]|nr:carbohydrate ABC transporter permease [Treponema sp.]
MKKRLSHGDKVYYIFSYALVCCLVLIVLYPMVYVVSASFSTAAMVTSGKVWLLPVKPTFHNYSMVLQYKSVYIGYRNTFLYTFCGTLINIIFTLLCAYPLSRKDLFGRGFFTFLFTFTMIFSGGMIPSYILMRNLRLINTVWAMMLPGAISVTNMIVTRTYFQFSIPGELLEASKLDGCSDAQYFFRVALPLSHSVIAVIALFYAVGHWNAYFNAFLYLSKQSLYPLQLFLREILVQNTFNSGMITDPDLAEALVGLQEVLKYAIIVLSTAPLMCFYPFAQKHFVKGVMIGSLKG